MEDIILLKQGEIVLKGLNRKSFEMKLVSNINRRLKPFGKFRVYSVQSAIYVEPQSDDCDMDGAYEAVKTIFGIVAISRAAACEKDKDALLETAKRYLGDALSRAGSFKVETKRADKSFPMTSIQLSQYVGGLLADAYPHVRVDVHNPDFTVHLEVRDYAAYVHGPSEQGAGGLPVGTNGRVVSLLSGGIDSPVSTYMIARRGVSVIPVHFFSFPYTSELAKEKVVTLSRLLTKYCGRLRLKVVPFTHIQEEIREKCPEELFTVIMRRFMMRISAKVAEYNGCKAIVTGENLGQVASQTLEAMAVTEACAGLPVLRPVIGLDKREIVETAVKIGTFDTSILPYEDCCTVFTPRHPRTKPRLDDVVAAESALDVDALVNEAFENIDRIDIEM
ncbi:thiamine biosynthesis protein ThiI [Sporobacter termitidis DSM 10068]|uniref:Probable tRNA sulfurtransferase n=1 Tax=Sporobacter termitidis DSM 10068 TaxID=1123282 RepID=A0A1M5VMD0_9FIRM|nr:tRNA uracil 4-sulfurtransferase ThiI [Sporobacter termitidis]SHH76360.1 thiamine biosynthesis protein ThiI [Sporobacter termitidis DSM 10068]